MTKTAAIIGGGVIGGGWAARFLLNGWNVRVFDPDPQAARKIGEVLENARRSQPALSDLAMPAEGSLIYCDTLEDAVTHVDWIQESVPERLDLKHKIYAQIQTHTDSRCIVASSTSGFKPTQLQQGAAHPQAIVVAHPFNPVYLLPLVELVPSSITNPDILARAKETITSLGMYPLHVKREIDAHIADRFLEAVWREALWLVRDGVATTTDIDNAIRYGFGLRWAQMGLFETYRVAGGEAGMKHFIEQFGPCLKWPWTRLTDVPELTDDLVNRITEQSDAQSGSHSIRDLERLRDDNLVAILRALKGRNSGAGALLNAHDNAARRARDITAQPLITIARTVPVDWTDYNGHMNESRYGQVFSDAADAVMALIGADQDYIAAGHSYFTVDIRIKFLAEARAGQSFDVTSRVIDACGKKLRLYHEMRATDGTVIATGAQLLLHVSLTTRKTCEPLAPLPEKAAALVAAQSKDR